MTGACIRKADKITPITVGQSFAAGQGTEAEMLVAFLAVTHSWLSP